jgi:glycosyltransferase involved in cell wall biosynthesis
MKVVHLNTHSYGGAATVARRLHIASLAEGMDSRFITKYGVRSDPAPGYTALRDARVLYWLRKKSADPRLYKLGKLVQHWRQHPNLANRPAGLEVFSALNTGEQFTDCTTAFDPDIIHLHWISGFLDHAAFFQRNRHKRFVWTLHDMNPFTGGCHYSLDCTKFTNGCRSCPQLAGTIDDNYSARILESKAKALAALADDQVIIVAPSQWLLDLSLRSTITSRFRHRRIENPSFNATATQQVEPAKEWLGLRSEKKIVLFVSDNLRNPRKGVDVLFAAARQLPRSAEMHFVGLGQRADAQPGLAVTFAGTVATEEQLGRYIACADVVVIPSAAENSPLVIIEALTCGTPVVAFSVGGIPELIDNESGVLARAPTAEALASALEEALFDRHFDRDRIRARAAAHAPNIVLNKYRAVYHELLAS